MDLKEIKPEYPDEKLKEPILPTEIFGLFKTVSALPTKAPKNYFDQIVIYAGSAYMFDTLNHVWITL